MGSLLQEQKISFFRSLRGRLIVLFMAASLVPLLLLGAQSYVFTLRGMQEAVFNGTNQSMVVLESAIEQWIHDREDNMLVLAGTARVRTMEPAKVADSVDQYFKQWGVYENITVYLPDGSTLHRTDGTKINVADRPYFQQALKGKLNISDPVISKGTGNTVFVVAAPIIGDNGAVVGVVGGAIPTRNFGAWLQQMQAGKTGEVYLLSKEGYFITPSRFEKDLKEAGIIKNKAELELKNDSYGARQALAGKLGVEVYENYRGKSVMGGYIPISKTGWALLVEQETSEALAEVSRLVNLLVIFVTAVGLALVVIGVIAANNITRPLGYLSQLASRVALGDLCRDMDKQEWQRIEKRDDEFGLIGRAFGRMTGDYLQPVAALALQIADTDLTGRVKPKSERDELSQALERMVNNLSHIVNRVRESSGGLNSASANLTQAASLSRKAIMNLLQSLQQIANGANQQSVSISKTAQSVDQMNQAILSLSRTIQEQTKAAAAALDLTHQIQQLVSQVEDNAKMVTNHSASASEHAHQGAATVKETIAGMEGIRQRVNLSAARVQEMGKHSVQIGVILETIEDIASQTNLLALNAAIEAARAGEHGKGFAVVADEVRKLAERASASTKEIANLVKEIQSTVSEAVNAMETSAEEVQAGVDRANKAGGALSNILTAADEVHQQAGETEKAARTMLSAASRLINAVEQVSTLSEKNNASTEEISAGASEVNEAIQNIASISQENSASTEEVNMNAGEIRDQIDGLSEWTNTLEEMSRSLQNLVSQFKLKEE